MRGQYGQDMTAYQSVRQFVHDYWLDGDVEPRDGSANSPQVPEMNSNALNGSSQLAKLEPFTNRVLLGRNTNGVAPVILPCELTNGGLPLLMVRIPGSPPTKVVLDTASDYLLIADMHKCKKCSVKMYGGAKSDLKQEAQSRSIKVHFGSQVDDVQFQTRDIQLGDFAVIPQVPVGLVKARKTRIKGNTHTFNILGIGAMGMTSDALGTSMIERLLQNYNQPKVFGFYFGEDLRDGLFILGYATKKTAPALVLPLYPHPTKPYYLLKIASLELIAHPSMGTGPILLENKNGMIPEALVDTGANFAAFPSVLEPYFAQKGRVHELYFHFATPTGLQSLRIPHSRLYNRKGREVFYFSDDRCVIGTFIMSLFSLVEFDFESGPTLRCWA